MKKISKKIDINSKGIIKDRFKQICWYYHNVDKTTYFSGLNGADIEEYGYGYAIKHLQERVDLAYLLGGYIEKGLWPIFFHSKEELVYFINKCIEFEIYD